MRLIRNSALALLVAASAVVLAANGIEVLSVDTQPDGSTIATTLSDGAPTGSYVEAVMVVNGIEVLADTQPVNPADGIAMVMFPYDDASNKVVLRDPLGNFIDEAPARTPEPVGGIIELE